MSSRQPLFVRATCWLLAAGSLLGTGCSVLRTPSMIAVPPAWRAHHPWGPEANDARARGCLGYHVYTRKMECWKAFAREHIQDGDMVFRYGRSFAPYQRFQTRFLARISDCPFSHAAIARWEGDTLWLYDAESEGVRKIPFEVWMFDATDGTLAIRRLKPELCSLLPQVYAYIEDKYRQNIPFDTGLDPGDEKLYCSELIEKAFLSAGIAISQPVAIRCLPNYYRYPQWFAVLVERVTPIRMHFEVFVPGNRRYGAYASPYYDTVYEAERIVHTTRDGVPVANCSAGCKN